MDGFDWMHPLDGSRTRGTLLVDEGSAKVVPRVHLTQPDGGACGSTCLLSSSNWICLRVVLKCSRRLWRIMRSERSKSSTALDGVEWVKSTFRSRE